MHVVGTFGNIEYNTIQLNYYNNYCTMYNMYIVHIVHIPTFGIIKNYSKLT